MCWKFVCLVFHIGDPLCPWLMAVGLAEQPGARSPPNSPPAGIRRTMKNKFPARGKRRKRGRKRRRERLLCQPAARPIKFTFESHPRLNGGAISPPRARRQSLNLDSAATGSGNRAFSSPPLLPFPLGLCLKKNLTSGTRFFHGTPLRFSPFADARSPASVASLPAVLPQPRPGDKLCSPALNL